MNLLSSQISSADSSFRKTLLSHLVIDIEVRRRQVKKRREALRRDYDFNVKIRKLLILKKRSDERPIRKKSKCIISFLAFDFD